MIIGILIFFVYFFMVKVILLVFFIEINGIGERCGLKYIFIVMWVGLVIIKWLLLILDFNCLERIFWCVFCV